MNIHQISTEPALLSLTAIAFAAGFGSVRRFNAVFASVIRMNFPELTYVRPIVRGGRPAGTPA